MLRKIAHKFFLWFRCSSTARFFFTRFPLLALTGDKVILLASPSARSGHVIVSGLSIPKFEYDLFHAGKWHHYVVTYKHDYITFFEEDGTYVDERIDFSDPRLLPVVQILETSAFGYFPFHYSAAFDRAELETKLPHFVS